MEQEYKYMVATRCFTFNHAPYIEDAMNGFAMQETSFPVITIIVDDASTDGEPEVIRNYLAEHFKLPYRTEETEYAHIICAKHKTNDNCEFVVFFLKYNHYSIKKSKFPYLSEWLDNAKYHALCEGDDYWIDNHKLQKQVKFLEENNEYGLCYTRTTYLCKGNFYNEPIIDKCDTKSLILSNPIRTLSTLYRSDLYLKYVIFIKKNNLPQFDYPLFLWFSFYSKIGYLKDITGVYRIVEESMSHSKTDAGRIISFYERCMAVRLFWINKLSLSPDFYYYIHFKKCYKYAIAKNDKDNIIKYRNKILLCQYKEKSFNYLALYFLVKTKIDVVLAYFSRFIKPVVKTIRKNKRN